MFPYVFSTRSLCNAYAYTNEEQYEMLNQRLR